MSFAGLDRSELGGVQVPLGRLLGQLVMVEGVVDQRVDVEVFVRVVAAAGDLANTAEVVRRQVHQILSVAEKEDIFVTKQI